MKRDIKLFLEDIVDSISKIEEYTKEINEESFIQENWVQDAVMRRLEVIVKQ